MRRGAGWGPSYIRGSFQPQVAIICAPRVTVFALSRLCLPIMSQSTNTNSEAPDTVKVQRTKLDWPGDFGAGLWGS